ncbi:MAG: ribonuclease 3, partial [Chloroflexi bacterium]|nr:ribonuclease 3 [Chloroflexota bacterium]
LGAILCDQGFEAAKEWTLGLFEDRLDALPDSTIIDDKSRLQEAIQAEGAPPPIYRTIDAQGPEHSKDFTVEVMVRERVLGTGRGSSKRRAQREAARQALERLAQEGC